MWQQRNHSATLDIGFPVYKMGMLTGSLPRIQPFVFPKMEAPRGQGLFFCWVLFLSTKLMLNKYLPTQYWLCFLRAVVFGVRYAIAQIYVLPIWAVFPWTSDFLLQRITRITWHTICKTTQHNTECLPDLLLSHPLVLWGQWELTHAYYNLQGRLWLSSWASKGRSSFR